MNMNNNGIPEAYKPISMWGYLGYQILFSIPCIGFILLIIKALSAKNVNVKNFARSYFCFYIIIFILTLLAGSVAGFDTVLEAISQAQY